MKMRSGGKRGQEEREVRRKESTKGRGGKNDREYKGKGR